MVYCGRERDNFDEAEFVWGADRRRYHVIAEPDEVESDDVHRVDGIEVRTFSVARDPGGRWKVLAFDDRTTTQLRFDKPN